MNQTVQKLIDNKLIEEKQIEEFEELIKKSENRSDAVYLYALSQVEFKKLTGHFYFSIEMNLSFGEEKPDATEQSKINQELYLYVSKLKSCELITDKQLNHQKEKIKQNEYESIFQLLPDLIDQNIYEEWMSPDKVIKYAEELLKNSIVTEKSFQTLKIDINTGKIKSHHQLIDYCKDALSFDLGKYSNVLSVYLEQIHREVSTLLPELKFTNFKYRIEIDSAASFNDYTPYKVVISIDVNNKTYKQKSFISPNDIGKNDDFLGKISSHEFYEIFNKILIDIDSPLRLHQVSLGSQYGQSSNNQYFGIIILSKKQLDVFKYSNSYIQISSENFKNSLTSNRIDFAIEEYQQIGLFKHLTKSQVEKAKQNVYENKNTSLNDILLAFPDVILMFDTELENLEEPYAELIREYKKISHNKFNATEIFDDFEIENKNEVLVKFKIKNKSYHKTLKIKSDWIDTDFFTFINSVVEDQNLSGKFYGLYTGGQEASTIYLTKEQYNHLKINKLLLFSDEWRIEDE